VVEEDPFETALARAIEGLPEEVRSQLATVAIVIEEEPTLEQLRSVHAYGLFGLYQGVPRTTYGANQAPVASRITLFRGPIMRANPTPDELTRAVEDTLRHEVAHHLGIGDARLAEIRAGRRTGGSS
jgi:predicted Zn-dependent protease with MMP-like domain